MGAGKKPIKTAPKTTKKPELHHPVARSSKDAKVDNKQTFHGQVVVVVDKRHPQPKETFILTKGKDGAEKAKKTPTDAEKIGDTDTAAAITLVGIKEKQQYGLLVERAKGCRSWVLRPMPSEHLTYPGNQALKFAAHDDDKPNRPMPGTQDEELREPYAALSDVVVVEPSAKLP